MGSAKAVGQREEKLFPRGLVVSGCGLIYRTETRFRGMLVYAQS